MASTLAGSCVASAPPRALPLRVISRPTPPHGMPHHQTRGTYPQVAGRGIELRRVNEALRNAVVAEQRRYVRVALAHEAENPDPIRLGYTGFFGTSTVPRLISANTVAVSA